MEELFVNLKLATKLKEKGFDEPCIAKYFNKLFSRNALGYWYRHNSGEISKNYIAAPLYQQVTDWFFNKHKMFVEADGYIIDSGPHDGCYGFKATVRNSKEYKESILFAEGEFPTREKAWTKAIEEALKLI